jgi:maleate isomerase
MRGQLEEDMIGWRARLGFMVPPGNPTIEPEMIALAPPGVSLHFHRMDAGGGVPGALDNQDRRTRAMIDSLDSGVPILAAVKPDIIVIAHTATSYYLGRERETALLARLGEACGVPVVTAFGAVAAALERLQIRRIAYGAPYSAETTAQGRAHLEAYGFTVIRAENLEGVTNIYDETAERAYRLAQHRQRERRGGVPDRDRHADLAGARFAGRRSRQAGDFERLGDDVARAAMRWRAPENRRLRPFAAAGIIAAASRLSGPPRLRAFAARPRRRARHRAL